MCVGAIEKIDRALLLRLHLVQVVHFPTQYGSIHMTKTYPLHLNHPTTQDPLHLSTQYPLHLDHLSYHRPQTVYHRLPVLYHGPGEVGVVEESHQMPTLHASACA
jgi:hypothetical protein